MSVGSGRARQRQRRVRISALGWLLERDLLSSTPPAAVLGAR